MRFLFLTKGEKVKGTILGHGFISGEDGKRYEYGLEDLKNLGDRNPMKLENTEVDFEISEQGRAINIFIIKSAGFGVNFNAGNFGANLNSAFSNLSNKASNINLSQSAELTNGFIQSFLTPSVSGFKLKGIVLCVLALLLLIPGAYLYLEWLIVILGILIVREYKLLTNKSLNIGFYVGLVLMVLAQIILFASSNSLLDKASKGLWGIVSDAFEIYWTTTNPIAFTKAFYDCATDGNFGKGLDLCKDIVSLSVVLTPFFMLGLFFITRVLRKIAKQTGVKVMSLSSWLVFVGPLLTYFWYFGHIIYAVGVLGVILGFLSIVAISPDEQNSSSNTALNPTTPNSESSSTSEQQ